MIYLTLSLFIISLVGIGALFALKGKTDINLYLLARTFFAVFGVAIILLGWCFQVKAWAYASFFSFLLYVLGAQISLWSIGISSEILGNAPESDNVRNSSVGNIFNGVMYVIACVAFTALGVISSSTINKLWGGHSDGFIKQVKFDGGAVGVPNWQTTTVRATDSFGKNVEIVIGVLWDPYRWVKGDTRYVSTDIEEKERVLLEDIFKQFRNDESRALIVVGTASHENAKENPEQEIERAQNRADRLAEVCKTHFVNKPHIYSLNLGAFKPDMGSSVFSALERRVIILVVNKGEDSRDLTSGVKNALVKARIENNFLIDARNYSLFDTDRFVVKPRYNF